MQNQINTYYIPTNPNIPKGHIYTLYLNHNTNLDLSQILNLQTITISQKEGTQEPTQITISNEDYTKLLELNNRAFQLASKRSEDIERFIQAETITTTELAKINTDRQELITRLTKKGLPQWII